jgi:hypothetical protein
MLGIATGMYAASQIEKDINKRINKTKSKDKTRTGALSPDTGPRH